MWSLIKERFWAFSRCNQFFHATAAKLANTPSVCFIVYMQTGFIDILIDIIAGRRGRVDRCRTLVSVYLRQWLGSKPSDGPFVPLPDPCVKPIHRLSPRQVLTVWGSVMRAWYHLHEIDNHVTRLVYVKYILYTISFHLFNFQHKLHK